MTLLSDRPTTRFHGASPAFAPSPPEARGLSRDEVRLLVARPDGVVHTRFTEIGGFLSPGDVLVVNTSATVNGEIDGHLRVGRARRPVVVHVATPVGDGSWVLELRSSPDAGSAVLDAAPGQHVTLAGGGTLTIVEPYGSRASSPSGRGNRLWVAEPADGLDVATLLAAHGRPIAYGYLAGRWPLAAYQTVFANVPGSAEMASAARPFTESAVTRLVSSGVVVAPVVLHTGVSSQEAGEGPQAERFAVPQATADLVNLARSRGRRIVAVGTTATRAVESAVECGRVVAREGWTDRVITPSEPPQVVTGLLTGWHDALASHLLLVEAVAGPLLTQRAYDEALGRGYAWHEFGDSCLLLPGPATAA